MVECLPQNLRVQIQVASLQWFTPLEDVDATKRSQISAFSRYYLTKGKLIASFTRVM